MEPDEAVELLRIFVEAVNKHDLITLGTACEKAEGLLAQSNAAPQYGCKTCRDTGEVEAMTSHLGPDDYTQMIPCPDCGSAAPQTETIPCNGGFWEVVQLPADRPSWAMCSVCKRSSTSHTRRPLTAPEPPSTGHSLTGAAGMSYTASAAPDSGRGDWPEDFADENGNYFNTCVHCGIQFRGYKRRVSCKLCTKAPDSGEDLSGPRQDFERSIYKNNPPEKASDSGLICSKHGVQNGIVCPICHPASGMPEDVIEQLAALEHEQWMEWAKSIANSEPFLTDGRKERWAKAMLPYAMLTEEQKEQDRILARRAYALSLRGREGMPERPDTLLSAVPEEIYHNPWVQEAIKTLRALSLREQREGRRNE